MIDIAVANMADMVRLATTQRGLDPRDFALLASGGAGPLHAPAVGEEIGATEVIVPPYPGMFSALGATLGSVRHEPTVSILRRLDELSPATLEKAFQELHDRANALLAAEPKGVARPAPERIVEARFAGQLFEMSVAVGRQGEPVPSIEEIESIFRRLYLAEYGFDLPEAAVQIVNLRLVAGIDLGYRGDALFRRDRPSKASGGPVRIVDLLTRQGRSEPTSVFRVEDVLGTTIKGPMLLEHSGATVWLQQGQSAQIGTNGQLVIKLSRTRS